MKIKINHITAIRSFTILILTAAIIILLYKACEQRLEIVPSFAQTEALLKKGDYAMHNGSPDSALHYYKLVYSSFTPEMDIDSKKACAKALNNSGYIYFFRYNDYPNSYRCFLDACDIAEETGSRRTLSRTYLNIGNIYGAYNITGQTIEMYRKAFLNATVDKDWEIVLTAFTNMAGAYI